MNTYYNRLFLFLFLLPLISSAQNYQPNSIKLVEYNRITTGAEKTEHYFPLLKGKKIAVVGNHTSVINGKHLIDSLINAKINIVRIFCPEHGFRGTSDAGELIKNSRDIKTGIPIISLYGNHKKPSEKDLRSVDMVLFDIQDVGVRFYTYISTLTYVMESCAENKIPLIVLDRPNPNGFYIDGPVMEKGFESFVGLHPVPVVYGMTIGEYARMVNGEKWLNSSPCELTVIPCNAYERNMIVKLPVRPSPNLPNWYAVYLYPSLCFFEGTIMSVGRGTDLPFQVYGHPDYGTGSFAFMPEPGPGSKHPKYSDEVCYGQNLIGYALNFQNNQEQLNMEWILEAYRFFQKSEKFFNAYFDKLAGNSSLRMSISDNYSDKQIRKKWNKEIESFKKIRSGYLLYPDFPCKN